jgi:hypothetical protein
MECNKYDDDDDVPILPIHVTCPTHHIVLDFIILTILGEEYKSCSSSSCSFLHPPITPSPFGPPCSQTPSVYVPPLVSETMFHNDLEQQEK